MIYKPPPLYLRHTQSSKNKIILSKAMKENMKPIKRKVSIHQHTTLKTKRMPPMKDNSN